MVIITYINIFCTAFILFTSIFLIIFGSKSISTIFHGIFWFVIFIYLLSLNLYDAGLIKIELSKYIHFFIPAFYSLFLSVRLNRFKFLFIIFIIIAVFSLFFINLIYIISYHFITWGILILFTVLFQSKSKNDIMKNNKNAKKYGFFAAIIISCSVLPFLIINIINAYIFPGIFSNKHAVELVLPPSLAIASMFFLYYTYKYSLVILNHDFYANIDFLIKSNAVEKKTIIEKVSAGLIHEIKNPIGAIQSLNQQLLENHKDMKNEKINDYLKIIDKEIRRTKNLAENYLNIFKKSSNYKKEIINIYDVLKSIIELLKYDLIKKDIKIEIDFNIMNTKVKFNSNHFRQIFLNLIYNSIEANAKNIHIYSTHKNEILEIYIKDDGDGIPDEKKKNIFSPFFTTKIDGTGMGLVICREILNENFSNIKLLKSKNKETIFNISINKQEEEK